MGAEADAGPVGGLFGVGIGVAVLNERGEKFVDEMRVRAAVTCTLGETQMRFFGEVINAFGREAADRRGQKFGEIRDLDFLRNFGFRPFCGVKDV